MTQGLSAVIDRAFHDLGLHRLEANIQPNNAASLAIVKKLGFEQEGYSPLYLMVNSDWQDHERWAIRVEIWKMAETHSVQTPPQQSA
jgi:ribosomal-protein-alanine N-acetyltransferase